MTLNESSWERDPPELQLDDAGLFSFPFLISIQTDCRKRKQTSKAETKGENRRRRSNQSPRLAKGWNGRPGIRTLPGSAQNFSLLGCFAGRPWQRGPPPWTPKSAFSPKNEMSTIWLKAQEFTRGGHPRSRDRSENFCAPRLLLLWIKEQGRKGWQALRMDQFPSSVPGEWSAFKVCFHFDKSNLVFGPTTVSLYRPALTLQKKPPQRFTALFNHRIFYIALLFVSKNAFTILLIFNAMVNSIFHIDNPISMYKSWFTIIHSLGFKYKYFHLNLHLCLFINPE